MRLAPLRSWTWSRSGDGSRGCVAGGTVAGGTVAGGFVWLWAAFGVAIVAFNLWSAFGRNGHTQTITTDGDGPPSTGFGQTVERER